MNKLFPAQSHENKDHENGRESGVLQAHNFKLRVDAEITSYMQISTKSFELEHKYKDLKKKEKWVL